MLNWFKRILGKDEEIESDVEKNEDYVVPKEQNLSSLSNGAEYNTPRMTFQYPKGNFRFPVIPDDEKERLAKKKREEQNIKSSFIDPQTESQKKRETNDVSTFQYRKNKRYYDDKQVEQLKKKTIVEVPEKAIVKKPAERKKPFAPTPFYSPIYGSKASINNSDSTHNSKEFLQKSVGINEHSETKIIIQPDDGGNEKNEIKNTSNNISNQEESINETPLDFAKEKTPPITETVLEVVDVFESTEEENEVEAVHKATEEELEVVAVLEETLDVKKVEAVQEVTELDQEEAAHEVVELEQEEATHEVVELEQEEAVHEVVELEQEEATHEVVELEQEEAVHEVVELEQEEATHEVVELEQEEAVHEVVELEQEEAAHEVVELEQEEAVHEVVELEQEEAVHEVVELEQEEAAHEVVELEQEEAAHGVVELEQEEAAHEVVELEQEEATHEVVELEQEEATHEVVELEQEEAAHGVVELEQEEATHEVVELEQEEAAHEVVELEQEEAAHEVVELEQEEAALEAIEQEQEEVAREVAEQEQEEVALEAIEQEQEEAGNEITEDSKVELTNSVVANQPKKRLVPFNVMMLKKDKILLERTKTQNNLPSLQLLSPAIQEDDKDLTWLEEQKEILNSTLHNFNVRANVVSYSKGPSVTRFEVHPEPGVKVNKITNLADDIKLALSARDIRLEAPIPGKNTIGIEVPNAFPRPVQIKEILGSSLFLNSTSPLTVAIGLDISGRPIVSDISKMPHGLIAGATGSGKSVCINSILISLLYKASPHEVRLILIDPKMVELAPYNDIPHLVSPVITDVKAATNALKWAVEEMENRYEQFVAGGARDIKRYNDLVEKGRISGQKLPYLVIIIDELADLMLQAPAEVEEAICRIAQKARACGIHMLIATQRPSVDVITGLIKANIPTRVSFSVFSQVDSRTVLDIAGAEKLLGKGDMLILENGMMKPIRVQGTYVSDDEIERVLDYVKRHGKPEYLFQEADLLTKFDGSDAEDDLFQDVCEFIVEQRVASTSLLQRRFRIGYNRAARLMDTLEEKGIISEAKGSKPREVLLNAEDLANLFE